MVYHVYRVQVMRSQHVLSSGPNVLIDHISFFFHKTGDKIGPEQNESILIRLEPQSHIGFRYWISWQLSILAAYCFQGSQQWLGITVSGIWDSINGWHNFPGLSCQQTSLSKLVFVYVSETFGGSVEIILV